MRKITERAARLAQRAGKIGLALTMAGAVPLVAEGATSKTATFTVSLTIQADCDITANPLDFGSTGIIQANIDQTTTVNVTCTKGTAYNIGLDQGSISGSAVATRLLGGTGAPTPTVILGSTATRHVLRFGGKRLALIRFRAPVPVPPKPSPFMVACRCRPLRRRAPTRRP
jgi:spore coat protein U-like protein